MEEESKKISAEFDELNSKHDMIFELNTEIEEETSRLNSEFKSLEDENIEILVKINEFEEEENCEILKVMHNNQTSSLLFSKIYRLLQRNVKNR